MRHGAWLLIALGLLLPTAGEAQTKRSFTFAWPAGMEVEVRYQAEILRVDSGTTRKSTVFRSGTLKVESDGEALYLRRQDTSTKLPWLDTYQEFLDHFPHLASTVVVDPSGRFQGAEMDAEFRELGERLVSRLPEAAREVARQRIQPSMLEARWADLWRFEVELWLGRPFRKGTRFTHRRTAPVPAGGGTMELELTAQVLGRVPCTPEQRRKKCVALEAVERVVPNSLMEAFATSELSAYEGATVAGMERRFTAVVERKTLRPYLYTLHHRLEQDPPEGKGLTLEEVNRSWRFGEE